MRAAHELLPMPGAHYIRLYATQRPSPALSTRWKSPCRVVPSIDELDDKAVVAGMLMALGVLAMALGLLRTETAGDLRILTTTGAGSRTRRTTLVTTAGDLAFLGAALGTIISYLVLVAFFAEQSQHPFDRNSGKSHLLIIMGMPVLVSIGGWIFSGHEPKAIARQPLK